MRLLRKIISQIWSKRSNKNTNLIDKSKLENRIFDIERQSQKIASQEHAYTFLKKTALPLLIDIARLNHLDLAGKLEFIIYNNLIKSFEKSDHYQDCFNLMDETLRKLAAKHRIDSSLLPKNWRPKRLVFFIHNLESNLAHAKLLCDLIHSYLYNHPEQLNFIRITGITGTGSIAQCYRELQADYPLSITPLTNADFYQALHQLSEQVNQHGDERCIVVAVPIGLSYLSGLLHKERLGWLSMKFEISSFYNLSHRFSFTSGYRSQKQVGKTVWRSAPPMFDIMPKIKKSSFLSLQNASRIEEFSTVFYTVNREEKIRNPEYLFTVSEILKATPESCFIWTGRQELPDITQWFNEKGLSERCFFAGWVDPDILLSNGHIFLDTPSLSGSIAAKAICCGIPVMTFENSHSWADFFHAELEKDLTPPFPSPFEDIAELFKKGLFIRCSSAKIYTNQAISLAINPNLRNCYSKGLSAYGQHYFLNNTEHARMHFENFSETF